MKYSLKHIAEYVLLRGIGFIFAVLPLPVALALGGLLAKLVFYMARGRVSEAKRRIRQVFGDQFDERQIRRIAWLSFRNLAFNGIEVLRAPSFKRTYVDRHIDYSSYENYRARVAGGQGCIIVVPHMGNWDLAAIAIHMLGMPVFALAARQRNPLTDAYLNRMRGAMGLTTLLRDDPGLPRNILRRLKAGETLALLIDLRSRTPALSIRFLGGTANIAGGMAMFARQAGAPIYPVILLREGWTRHRWHFKDPIRPDPSLDKQQDALRMTQQVMDIFDAAIRQWPEQYFWYNKRWVLDPL